MFNYKYLFLVALIPVLIIFSCCVTQDKQETIKIGFMAPLSGDMAVYGQSSKGGLQLAADDINYMIDGKKVEFIFEDSKCDAKSASEVANKLINIDGVKYILGFVCSSELLSTAPNAENAKVLTIGSATTSPALQTVGKYSFAMYPLDDFEAKLNAEFIVNKLGKKNVALLLCQSDWCKGYEKPFTETVKALGGNVAIIEFNEQNAKDLKTQLTKIKETEADVLFAVQYPEAYSNLVIQTKELELNVPVYVPQVLTEDSIRTMPGLLEGYYTVRAAKPGDQTQFLNRLKAKTGLPTPEIDLTAGRSYDALIMLKSAIEKANTLDTEIVKDVLLTVKYTGITGYHEFDKDGVPANANYEVFKVVNDQFVKQAQ